MLKLLSLALVVVAVAGQGSSNSRWYCSFVPKEDCSSHKIDMCCGTDGTTYRNTCYLVKASCKNNNVNLNHKGACVGDILTTVLSHTTMLSPNEILSKSQSDILTTVVSDTSTLKPKSILDKNQILTTPDCHAVILLECSIDDHYDGQKFCGTDGVTYDNFCVYEKARCIDRELHIERLGDCSA